MGSLILFVLGVAAPLAAALALLWRDERRSAYAKLRMDRLVQDNRGLKLALNSRAGGDTATFAAGSDVERREIDQLMQKLSQSGTLLETLRTAASGKPAVAASAAKAAPESAALQQAVAEWGPEGLSAALDQLKARLAAIAEMEMIWADPHANVERDSLAMLERTLWVFEPEYVVGDGSFAIDQRFGAVAKPSTATGLYPGLHSKEGEQTLVVDLQSARTTVGADQQLQAWNNVRDLIRGGAVRERDPVDVYVVGGAVDELDGNPRIEGRHRNVRITSYDYGQLIARAKRLTFGLYDGLKDTAPFLRHHRDEISAAQRAATEQAAAEASAPPLDREEMAEQAHEPVEPGEPRTRQEDLAEAMRKADAEPPSPPPPARKNEFDGEHVVIGKRKR